ncbi:MAG: TRAM domain-containing protein [Clostridia bacterium]|nr:TRAM domain-containing protein [Clostridia bacterium]
MKSKHIQQLLRILLMAAGAGAGIALAFLCVQVHRMTNLGSALDFGRLVMLYGGMALLGVLLGHILAPRVIRWCSDAIAAVEQHMDTLSLAQLTAMSLGLISGLLIAALLSQVLSFLGDSIFTLASSAVLYVVLGVTGLSIGKRRTEDIAALMDRLPTLRDRRHARHAQGVRPKVLDCSVLIDGRVEAVRKAGFIEGELLLPACVLEELHRMADAADEAKRLRGRRGLEVAERLQATLRDESGDQLPPQEWEVQLTALAREANAVLLTSDASLAKAAKLAGVAVMNINDLACALRSTAAAGDVLTVKLTKEGREPGQGVGYLDDGTMLVVVGGREHVGEIVEVTVTSVLQTSAGRMVFAKMND